VPESLSQKTILITGGTSRLGASFVRRALKEKARVFFTYYQADSAAEALCAEGATAFQADLGSTSDVEKLAEDLARKTERLDVLIHNAAATADAMIHKMSEEDWDRVISVGLKAPYYLTKKCLPLLLKSVLPKVFMITSRTAYYGSAGVCNYAAAKAGLIGLVKSLAQEAGQSGMLVNAVNPGFMFSRMTEKLPENIVSRHLESSPLKAWSNPEEVADFLVFLSSDSMRQVTGQVIHYESRNIAY